MFLLSPAEEAPPPSVDESIFWISFAEEEEPKAGLRGEDALTLLVVLVKTQQEAVA